MVLYAVLLAFFAAGSPAAAVASSPPEAWVRERGHSGHTPVRPERALFQSARGIMPPLAAAASAGLALHPAAVQVPQPAVSPADTLCRFYHEERAARRPEKRAELAAAVRSAHLSFSEKAWLLYNLADPVMKWDVCSAIAGDVSVEEVEGGTDHKEFVTGVSIERTRQVPSRAGFAPEAGGVGLHIFRNAVKPAGTSMLAEIALPLLSRRVPGESGRVQAGAAAAEGHRDPLRKADADCTFCRSYRRVLRVASETEAVAAAAAVRSAVLSDAERSFLIYSLIKPGMSAETAEKIGGRRIPTRQGRPGSDSERRGVSFYCESRRVGTVIAEVYLDISKSSPDR